MRHFLFIPICAISILMIACGSDDSSDNNTNDSSYYAFTADTSWTYDNQSEIGPSRDSLYVENEQQVDGNTYVDLGAEQPVNGFMTTILSENLLRNNGAALLIKGDLGTIVVEGFPQIDVPLDDLRLFDGNESVGTELALISDQFTQDYMGFPLIVTFSVRSVQGAVLDTYTAGAMLYENVINSQLIINIEVVTEVEIAGTTIQIPILTSQDVITADNFYAEGVGMVYSEVVLNYQLEDLSSVGLELPFPSEANETSTQTLDVYVQGDN